MSDLPVDIIIDIFTKLPAKTLLRFRCISKQFLSIIDGKDFVKRHLQFHSSRQKQIFRGGRSEYFSFNNDSIDNISRRVDLSIENWKEDGFNIIGSCDGLLALKKYSDDTIAIFNVSTKRHRMLPNCWIDKKSFVDGFGL